MLESCTKAPPHPYSWTLWVTWRWKHAVPVSCAKAPPSSLILDIVGCVEVETCSAGVLCQDTPPPLPLIVNPGHCGLCGGGNMQYRCPVLRYPQIPNLGHCGLSGGGTMQYKCPVLRYVPPPQCWTCWATLRRMNKKKKAHTHTHKNGVLC